MASRRDELYRYCTDVFGPLLRQAGFETRVFDNPRAEFGPILIGTRIEGPALPTMLIYGHGDVRAMPERWRQGLDPWRLSIEGDRIYGRGVVDNKGQHLLAPEALSSVIAERGSLGFNAKFMVETGEETGRLARRGFLRSFRSIATCCWPMHSSRSTVLGRACRCLTSRWARAAASRWTW